MPKEREPDNLQEEVRKSVGEILERNLKLARGVHEAFIEGKLSTPEVSAALKLIEGMSQTVRGLAEDGSGKEQVIFSKKQAPHSPPRVSEVMRPASEHTEGDGPKTFGELLTLEIKKALGDKQKFSNKDLLTFVVRRDGAKRILNLQDRKSFNQQDAIEILQRIFTTTSKLKLPTTEGELVFTRRMLSTKFGFASLDRDDLDRWSFLVGHNWTEKPKVDFPTAMQIRGLAILKRLSNTSPKS